MDIRHCPNQSDLRLCPNQSHCDTYISNPENSLKRGIPKFKFLSRSPCDESGVATILPRNAYALDSNIEVRFYYIFKTHTLKWYQLISQRCFHSILWCVYWLDTPFISIVVVEVIVIMKMIMAIMILIILSRHSFYLFIYLFIYLFFIFLQSSPGTHGKAGIYFIIWAASWQNQLSDCAPSEDSDQPRNPPSLIRVFAVRMKNAWVLSFPLSAQRRLWSDWADAQADLSLRWTHTHFVGFVMTWLILPALLIIWILMRLNRNPRIKLEYSHLNVITYRLKAVFTYTMHPTFPDLLKKIFKFKNKRCLWPRG